MRKNQMHLIQFSKIPLQGENFFEKTPHAIVTFFLCFVYAARCYYKGKKENGEFLISKYIHNKLLDWVISFCSEKYRDELIIFKDIFFYSFFYKINYERAENFIYQWKKNWGLVDKSELSILFSKLINDYMFSGKKEISTIKVLELFKIFFELGVDINTTCEKNNTALHIAAIAGEQNMVEWLLHNGADITISNREGLTAWMDVVSTIASGGLLAFPGFEESYRNTMRLMLQIAKNKVLYQCDAKGNTALHLAAAADDLPMVQLLLDAGADLSLMNNEQRTPFVWIFTDKNNCFNKEKEPAALYIIKKQPKIINMQYGLQGNTPLHDIARLGFSYEAIWLLQQGADPRIKNNQGYTPLMLVVSENFYDTYRIHQHQTIPRFIIEKEPAIINDREPISQNTILHIVAEVGDTDWVQWLIEKGASINTPNQMGYTPLDLAQQKGHKKVAKMLLSAGATGGKFLPVQKKEAVHTLKGFWQMFLRLAQAIITIPHWIWMVCLSCFVRVIKTVFQFGRWTGRMSAQTCTSLVGYLRNLPSKSLYTKQVATP